MARVVHRRSSPPYLLIVFVFLFLISTGLAIWKFVDEDRLNQDMLTKQAELDQMNKDLAKWVHPTEGWSKVLVEQNREYQRNLESMVQEAIEHVLRGIKLAGHREKSYLYLGRLYKAIGRPRTAEKASSNSTSSTKKSRRR